MHGKIAILAGLLLAVGLGTALQRGDAPATNAGSADVPASRSDRPSGGPSPSQAEGRTDSRPSEARPHSQTPSTAQSGPEEPGQGSRANAVERPPRSLDDESASEVERRLRDAIARAIRERGIHVAGTLIERILSRGDVRVIVAQAAQGRALEPLLDGARHGPTRYFRAIPFVALEVGPQALLALLESGDVVGIEEDEVNRPGLADSVPLIAANDAVAAGHGGRGWAVAVLDTGVDLDHPFFADRLVDEACFSLGGDCPDEGTTQYGPGAGQSCSYGCGHGSHVAGAALGFDASQPFSGVAPEASLISIQVYSQVGGRPGAYTSDLIAALEHVYDLRAFYSIAAVNMSLGGTVYSSQQQCDVSNAARKAAIDLLRSVGIATVVSAGNNGREDGLSAPGCISSAISVGASSKADAVASFSNSASFLSLLAPGVLIRSSAPGGGYGSMSGTSISAPHVAGAWASILSASPESSVDAVLFALQATGAPIRDDRNGLTTPRIDVMAAIEMLSGADGSPNDPPQADPATSPTGPAAGGAGSSCGLVGLELLPLLWLTHRRRRIASRGRARKG